MALIYCRECGQQISEQAPVCPKCGAPQQSQKKKGNKGFFLVVILIIVLVAGGYFYLTSQKASPAPATSETRQDRVDMADRLLSKDCTTLTNMSTEYIKNDAVAAALNALGNSKCDCIKEKLREKLADKYTLTELQAFDKKPLHEVQEIKDLIEQNNEELKSCFPLTNKIKDKVVKK